MSRTTLTDLDHLLAVFTTRQRIEHLGDELRIAAGHHTELAANLGAALAAGAYDAAYSVITPAGARHLAETHDTAAADSTDLADTVNRALHPDLEERL